MEVCNPTESLGNKANGENNRAATLEHASTEAGESLVPAASPARNDPNDILSTWVASDPKSIETLQRVTQIADSASTVLIRGENGTGKDLLAWLLHYLGTHCDEPLIRLDCSGLPAALLEAELFGCERALDGGQSKRARLEMAGRGTVVLDEVAALPMPLQSKLLRVIEEKRFQRCGGGRTIELAARIVALTTIDLERAVARRSFREDLYYRLTVCSIHVPPLRERLRDVAPLVTYWLAQLASIHRRPQLVCSGEALAALERYSFPGNVRELRNLLERAVVQGSAAEVTLEDLPAHLREHGVNGHKKSLEELEREYIAHILEFTRGKKTKAAAILGISRKTLLEKRKRYGLG